MRSRLIRTPQFLLVLALIFSFFLPFTDANDSAALAQTPRVAHIFEDNAYSSSYRNILTDAGIALLPAYYVFDRYVLGGEEDPISGPEAEIEISQLIQPTKPIESTAPDVKGISQEPLPKETPIPEINPLYDPDTAYSFALETHSDLLILDLTFLDEKENTIEPSQKFKFRLVYPDGSESIYYDLKHFSIYNPPMGTYSFDGLGSDFDSYKLLVESQLWSVPSTEKNGMLLIEPDLSLSDTMIQEIVSFAKTSGSLMVISHPDLAEAFDFYFYPFQFDRALTTDESALGFTDLRNREIDLIENNPPPDNCADISYIEIKEDALLKRVYCIKDDGRFYNLSFISKDLFKLDRKTSGYSIFIDSLGNPYPFSFSSAPVTNDVSETEKSEKRAENFKALLVLFFLFILILLVTSKSAEKIPVFSWIRNKILHLSHGLNVQQRAYFFLAFAFFGLLALYDFFFLELWYFWFIAFALVLGAFNFISLEKFPLHLKPYEQKWLRFHYALFVLIPFLVVFSIILPPYRLSYQNSPSLVAAKIKNDIIALSNAEGVDLDEVSWGVPGNSLFFTKGPFWVEAELPSSIYKRPVKFRAQIKTNSAIEIRALDASDEHKSLFFDSRFNDFSKIKDFETISLYRNASSPLIKTKNDAGASWENFIKNNFPTGAHIGYTSEFAHFDPDHFLNSDHQSDPIIDGPNNLTAPSLNLTMSDFSFYTHLTDHLELSLTFKDVRAEQKLRFALKNAAGQVVYEETFKLIADPNIPQTIQITPPDIFMKGVYQFSFKDINPKAPPMLTSLAINSPQLVFGTDTLPTQGSDQLYFKNLTGSSFSYASPATTFSFFELAGSTLLKPTGEPISDFDELETKMNEAYFIGFPSLPGVFTSTHPVLYSFSKESWFNPFQFNFSPFNKSVDYALSENHYGPYDFAETNDWIWVEDTFNVFPSEDKIRFEFNFLEDSPESWMMLQKIELYF